MKIRHADGVEFEEPVTVPAATADGHALNRDTADGRYTNKHVWTWHGALHVSTNDLPALIIRESVTLVSLHAYVKTAPTGAAIQIDLNKNGSSVLSAVLSVADAAQTGSTTGFSTATASDGDVLTIDVDQVGSTEAGRDLTLTLITQAA